MHTSNDACCIGLHGVQEAFVCRCAMCLWNRSNRVWRDQLRLPSWHLEPSLEWHCAVWFLYLCLAGVRVCVRHQNVMLVGSCIYAHTMARHIHYFTVMTIYESIAMCTTKTIYYMSAHTIFGCTQNNSIATEQFMTSYICSQQWTRRLERSRQQTKNNNKYYAHFVSNTSFCTDPIAHCGTSYNHECIIHTYWGMHVWCAQYAHDYSPIARI